MFFLYLMYYFQCKCSFKRLQLNKVNGYLKLIFLDKELKIPKFIKDGVLNPFCVIKLVDFS